MEEKERKMSKEEEDDIAEFKEVMETLRESVPALIKGIVDALYSAQNAEDFGKQVAGFYKSMIDAGMNPEQAFELTKKFMESRDIAGVLKKVLSEGNWGHWAKTGKQEDIAEKVIKEVKRELEEQGEE